MRDRLPDRVKRIECGVINLDDHNGPGTHWVAYYKKNNNVVYFDSFGNLQPPAEFIKYVGGECSVMYNYDKYQNFGDINCGHLCLSFLYKAFDESNKNIT